MRVTLLPYGHQSVDEADIAAVVQVLRSEWLTTGPEVERFETAAAAYVGARYAVAFSSATAALHGAVVAAGVGPGDEGITTPMTFCSTANCLLFQGARPVFADVEEATLTIDPEAIKERITRKTKVVIPMDYAGHPADLEPIRALAKRHRLLVIEDACHALGAEYRGQRVGSLSDMTIFSFHPVKHITTGEGGMVVTNDPTFATRLSRFRDHGITRDLPQRAQEPWYYEMTSLGWNYRLSDIACALGCSQLKRLAENLRRRREIAARYQERLAGIPGVSLPTVRPGVAHARHLYPIRLDLRRLEVDRGAVVRALHAERIGVQVHYIPVPLHPYYRQTFGYRSGDYPVAEEAYRRLISLPIFPGMTDRDLDDVIEALTKVLAVFGRRPRRARQAPALAHARGR